MLELRDLTKRYGSVIALDGCSLSVHPGRMLGFLGPNGAGKTTAMRTVFGLALPDAGTVRWRGEPPTEADRQRFGYMPEQRGLYPRMRAFEQVAYFARLHGLDAGAARAAAEHWLDRLGLADRHAARVEELSHGNQQRVQLAVALAHEPELLVLDEPFSGLDPIGVATMSEVVRDAAARGAAVVFSSHQLDLVEDLCDDVAVINRGRVMLEGDVRDVRAASAHRYLQLSLEVRGATPWEPLRGVLEWRRGAEARFRLPADADPAALLAAAQRAGDVGYFRFEPPSLTDLFAEAVRA